MDGKGQANVGQLRLIDGARVEDSSNLVIAEQASLLLSGGRGKGRLYVLAELSGGAFGREELFQDLVGAISEEYFHTPGTITYGLRQAVLLANTHLLHLNERVNTEQRVGGVACVVLRGREAFIAQAGWPMVYLIHEESVQTFPDTTLEDGDTSMLGQRQTTEVRLFRAPVRSGDRILIVDGPMARQLGITRIGQIVSGSVNRAMSNLETLAPPEDCTALLVQVGSSKAQAHEAAEQWTFMPVDAPPQPDEEQISPAVASAMEPELAQPEPAIPQLEEAIPQPERVVSRTRAEEPKAPGGQRRAARASRSRRTGPGLGAQVSAALQAVGRAIRGLGERLLPDKAPDTSPAQQRRRRTARSRRQRSQSTPQVRWGIVAAIVIPILVLAFVWGYKTYRDWSTRSQYEGYVEQAKLKRDIALGTDSPVVARDYWLEVLSLVEQAAKLQPDLAEVLPLRAQAEAEVDRIDGVTRLGQFFRIHEYSAPESAPTRVIVAGLDVYVLDKGAGRVYHHALNELRTGLRNPNAEQVLVEEGQEIETQRLASLIDIAWMEDGGERQAGALLILDRNGLLLEYDPSWEQLRTQLVGGRDTWSHPVAMRTFDSNLYLLDGRANQVFKYQGQQYAAEPSPWIQDSEINLNTAIDLGIDGSIYVLHGTGKLSKYYGGEAVPFIVTQMRTPLSGADALYAETEDIAQYLYVASGSEMRIVQLDREGVFVRQLVPSLGQEDAFRQLAGLYVDEPGSKLYVIARNALYVTDLPPVTR